LTWKKPTNNNSHKKFPTQRNKEHQTAKEKEEDRSHGQVRVSSTLLLFMIELWRQRAGPIK